MKPIKLEGGHLGSIEGWETQLREGKCIPKVPSTREASSAPLSSASSPLSDLQAPA